MQAPWVYSVDPDWLWVKPLVAPGPAEGAAPALGFFYPNVFPEHPKWKVGACQGLRLYLPVRVWAGLAVVCMGMRHIKLDAVPNWWLPVLACPAGPARSQAVPAWPRAAVGGAPHRARAHSHARVRLGSCGAPLGEHRGPGKAGHCAARLGKAGHSGGHSGQPGCQMCECLCVCMPA